MPNSNSDSYVNCTVTRNLKPSYIQEHLDSPPASVGGRHEDIISLSLKMVGEGYPDDHIFSQLLDRYPHKPASEIRRAIEGAHKLNPKPAAKARRSSAYEHGYGPMVRLKRYNHNGSSKDIPEEEIKMPYSRFFREILGFTEDELIWFAFDEEHLDHDSGATDNRFTPARIGVTPGHVERALDRMTSLSPEGSYYAVNPFKPSAKDRTEKSVSRFLYTVLESDTIPKERQLAIYRQSGLPITALVDSGGKSIHAIVRIAASSLEEYKERVRKVHEFLPQCFDSTFDASRFTRLPNANRGDKRQRLLETNIGPASFEEWEEQLQYDDGLPESDDMADLLEKLEQEIITEPKPLVQNFLHKEEVAIFGGASKSNKSWTMMELALSVSKGTKFLKWEAHSGKVLYVDTELTKFHFTKRMAAIAKATGCNTVGKGEITPLLLRGTRTTLDELVPALKRRAKGCDLICIDAIYSVLGDREENSNDHIAQIGALLLELSVATGAAVVFTHHFSKGSQIGKRGIEKTSGAGSWGRFPDVSLSIDQHTDEACFNFEVDARNRPQQPPFVARRNGPVWQIDSTLKVERKTNTNKSDVTDILDILVNECGGEASPGGWFSACELKLGISRKVFDGRKEKAIKQKLVVQSGKTKTTICSLPDGVVRNDETGRYERKGQIKAVIRSTQEAEQPF